MAQRSDHRVVVAIIEPGKRGETTAARPPKPNLPRVEFIDDRNTIKAYQEAAHAQQEISADTIIRLARLSFPEKKGPAQPPATLIAARIAFHEVVKERKRLRGSDRCMTAYKTAPRNLTKEQKRWKRKQA